MPVAHPLPRERTPRRAGAIGWVGLLLIAACHGTESHPHHGTHDPGGTFGWTADADVRLPYVTVGHSVPDGTLAVREVGGADGDAPIAVSVDGPFEVTGDLGPLAAGEERDLTVSYTGGDAAPTLAAGLATLTIGDETATVRLGAVVGDPEIPSATWSTDDWGTRTIVALPSAPYPDGDSTWTDPSVLVFVPPGLTDAGGVDVVTHLHGHNAVLADVVAEEYLVEQASMSGRDAILVVPQGPYDYPSGDFGKLMDAGGHERLIRDVIAMLYRDGYVSWPKFGHQALTSHSGGYLATSAILQHGGLPIDAVHLYDSLYGEEDVFQAFAEGGGVFRSNYTSTGGTDDNNVALRSTLERDGYDVSQDFSDDALLDGDLTIAWTSSTHGRTMVDHRGYERWLAASGLARRPGAPPELRSALAKGDTAVVTWLPDGGGEATWRVEGSDDGKTWDVLATTSDTRAEVPARAWIRVVEDVEDPEPSDVYGATGGDWLVVDGFDRVLDGSWHEPTHPFAAKVGNALGKPFSACSNEAVARGEVRLSDYDHVLWLLGDEGLGDDTFDADEMAAIEAYLAGGGELVVSGSELGYATDGAWLEGTLGVGYVADDAGTDEAAGYRFGVAYPEDYPDVLSGDETVWTYSTGGAAAVRSGKVEAVGFPLETLSDDDLAPAVRDLIGRLP